MTSQKVGGCIFTSNKYDTVIGEAQQFSSGSRLSLYKIIKIIKMNKILKKVKIMKIIKINKIIKKNKIIKVIEIIKRK